MVRVGPLRRVPLPETQSRVEPEATGLPLQIATTVGAAAGAGVRQAQLRQARMVLTQHWEFMGTADKAIRLLVVLVALLVAVPVPRVATAPNLAVVWDRGVVVLAALLRSRAAMRPARMAVSLASTGQVGAGEAALAGGR